MSTNSIGRSFLAALLVLGLVGCSDDTKPTPDKGVADKGVADKALGDKPAGDKALGDKGPAGEAKVDSKPKPDSMVCPADGICGQLYGFMPPNAPVSGVQVCVSGSTTPPCVTSDAAGAYSYAALPLTTDFALKFTKTDYVTFIAPFGKNQTDRKYSMALLKTSDLATLAALLQTTVKAGKGHIILSSFGTTGAGTSFTLAPTSGEGPYYVSDLGLPDKTLKETSSKGIGAAINLDPGMYTVTYTNSKSLTCARLHGWEGTTAGTLKLEVAADSTTVVSVTCK